MILGTVGQPVLVEVVLADRSAVKYPRAKVLDAAGTLVTTLPMTHRSAFVGTYQAAWTSPALAGHYSVAFEVFNDAGFTVLSDHEPGVEHIRVVSDFELALVKLLAHQGENVRDTVLVADVGTGRPLTARRKLYATKADALADVSPIATIDVVATYPGPSTWNDLVRTLAP
jgi:hypothetical protein